MQDIAGGLVNQGVNHFCGLKIAQQSIEKDKQLARTYVYGKVQYTAEATFLVFQSLPYSDIRGDLSV